MASPLVLSYTLLDTNGVKAATRAYGNVSGAVTTISSLIGSYLELGTAIDDATNAQIVGGQILVPVLPDAGWKTAPVDENDVSDNIVLNFSNASTKYVTEFLLPAFLQAMITGGKVDLTQAALAALIAILDNTSGGADINYVNPANQDNTALRDAFQSDRKYRRQLSRLSRSFPS